jgi:hypothetical protein
VLPPPRLVCRARKRGGTCSEKQRPCDEGEGESEGGGEGEANAAGPSSTQQYASGWWVVLDVSPPGVGVACMCSTGVRARVRMVVRGEGSTSEGSAPKASAAGSLSVCRNGALLVMPRVPLK